MARPHIYDKMAAAREPLSGTFAGTIDDRLNGLGPLLAEAHGASVLDIGCNAGYVAEAFAEAGATLVRGLDFYEPGLTECRERLDRHPHCDAVFRNCDFAAGRSALESALEDGPARFDIVLYLGVHQHLGRQIDAGALGEFLDGVVERCATWLATRAPEQVMPVLDQDVRERGFTQTYYGRPSDAAGFVAIYRRGDVKA